MSSRPVGLFDQAIAHHQAGNLPQAEALYRRILTAQPAHTEALGLLGRLAVQSGHSGVGLGLIDQALRLRPGNADLLGHRAVAEKSLGRLDDAIRSFRAALAARPGDFTLLFNLGNTQREAGRLADAAATLGRAVKRQPGNPDAHNNLGIVLRQQGAYQQAASSFRRAVACAPDAAPFYFNLCAALELAGELGAAADALGTATRLAPDNADAWRMLGAVLCRAGKAPAAIAAYGEALRYTDSAALRTDLAGALAASGAREAAVSHLRAAAALAPDDPKVLTDLGTLLRDTHDDDGAVAILNQALRLNPDNAGAKYHLGLTHLLAGRLREGWPLYEFRLPAMTGACARFATPIWRGQPMRGETLLLHAEQGLGDTLQFCRFVPLVAAASQARVILEVQPPLLSLLAGLAGVDSIMPAGAALPPFDRHCPLPSLPIAFDTALDTLPAGMPYLCGDPSRVAHWRGRLSAVRGLKVGLVWAGNPEYEHDSLRSLPFETLAALGGLPGVTFVSLQKDRGAAPAPITVDWTEELTDVGETAALMAALDLVVSADTAMVHLAGALARPVWLLNRYDTDWRWFADRTGDSPWYPTLRQFRQTRRGDWNAVVDAVRHALVRWQRRVADGAVAGLSSLPTL